MVNAQGLPIRLDLAAALRITARPRIGFDHLRPRTMVLDDKTWDDDQLRELIKE